MIRQAIFVVAAGLSCHGPVSAQSICNDSELVFVGRADAPVTYHVTGEAEIEKARQNFVGIEEELARLPKPWDEPARAEQATEIAIRLVKAQSELSMRKAMYPRPYDVTLIPLHVVRAFRGVNEPTLMLSVRPDLRPMTTGEEYLISGQRSKNLIPPFPEMGELASLAYYVDAGSVVPAALAEQHLQFLASTVSGATVMGTLRMRSFSDLSGAVLAGVRVHVTSADHVVEVTTREDGSFVATGVRAGELAITPVLSSDLTVVERYPQKVVVREGGCATVELRAAVNGRVRGRIVTAPGVSLDTVKLGLRVMRENRRAFGSHDASFGTSARADGTFEFSGVSPGIYLLSASVQDSGRATGTARTYYPGTDDVDAAMPVVVGKATEHNGFDFVVQTQ